MNEENTAIKKLSEAIQNKTVGNLSREARNHVFMIIGNTNENHVASVVGYAMKEKIMSWWFAMCDVRRKERGG